MSNKSKKVQFNEKRRVRKYERDDEEDDGSENGGDATDELGVTKKIKHSLDSDEEDDNTEKYEILNRSALNDIGQEEKTAEFEGDIKLTPFNMKEELSEGDFDKDGYYHWKSKDKDVVKDAWLDNIDWANVNTFSKKSYDLLQKSNEQEGGDEGNGEDQGDDEEEDEEEELDPKLVDEKSQIDMFKKMIPFLKPNETILRAIKRLGKSSSGAAGASSSGGASLSASQRWLKKKNTSTGTSTDQATATVDKASLEKLTEMANFFIDQGFYDIYEETLESLKKKIETSEKKFSSSMDMFADEINESDLKSSSSTAPANQEDLIKDSVVKWIYKLTNSEDAQVHGPFTSQEMLEKSEKGELGESGVWCRRVNEAPASFYSSKRIDFDLYT